jgi:hypothetical protein
MYTHAHANTHVCTHTHTHTHKLTSCLGPGATAPGLVNFITLWMILKAVPGKPGKFYRLFRAPLNNLGTQCTSLVHMNDVFMKIYMTGMTYTMLWLVYTCVWIVYAWTGMTYAMLWLVYTQIWYMQCCDSYILGYDIWYMQCCGLSILMGCE